MRQSWNSQLWPPGFLRSFSRKPRTFPYRVAAYARVSPRDRSNLDRQCVELRDYAAIRGWTIVLKEAVVLESSDLAAAGLPKLILDAAKGGAIDLLLVKRLDLLGDSLADVFYCAQQLSLWGVGLVSMAESVDMTTMVGRAGANLLGAIVGLVIRFHSFFERRGHLNEREVDAIARLDGLRTFNRQSAPILVPFVIGLLVALLSVLPTWKGWVGYWADPIECLGLVSVFWP